MTLQEENFLMVFRCLSWLLFLQKYIFFSKSKKNQDYNIPHFEWELRRVENRGNSAHCDMCGKGMFEREDTFTAQYYATHPLYHGELLIGKKCFRYMEKKINGDYEIRDMLDVTNGPRKKARR